MKELKNLSLLYVEDESETLKLYLRYFQTYFKITYSAKNGKDALDLYHEYKPDVVILDINIPILNGIEVAKNIRNSNNNTKIIMLTAMSDKQTFLQLMELGLTTFLEKPVSRSQLIEAFGKLIENNKKIISKINNQCYIWNTSENELYCNNISIKLTKNESKLFQLFMNNINKVFSYQDIYEEFCFENDKEYSEASIKTLIRGLRLKLPADLIQNIYGIGYKIKLLTE